MVNNVRLLLARLGPAPIKSLEGSSDLIALVAHAWDDLPLTEPGAGGMTIEKLYRAEDLEWDPPKLSFRIERHGAVVVCGSKKASYQRRPGFSQLCL